MPKILRGGYLWKNIYRDGILLIKNKKTGKVFKCLFDKEDADKIKSFSWYPHYNKDIKMFYAVSSMFKSGFKKTIRIHRLVLGVTSQKEIIDHINHNPMDNRKSNLRVTDDRGNMCNMRNHPSGFPGVSLDKRQGKFVARVNICKHRKHLGAYKNLEEAARKVWEYGESLFGDKNPYKKPLNLIAKKALGEE